MRTPNFSESQLQQLTNIEIVVRILNATGRLITPFIPSLPAEALLFYDTAFHINNIRHLTHSSGYNLFLQYKLSCYYVSPGAAGWNNWNTAFYRFNLYHGNYHNPDFKQRDGLIALATQGYTTMYVSNNFYDNRDLIRHYQNQQLCDVLPCFKIDPSWNGHYRVSHVDWDTSYYLNIEPIKKSLNVLSAIFLEQEKATDIEEDVIFLDNFLRNYENEYLETVKPYSAIEDDSIEVKAARISIFLRIYFDLHWFRYNI